MILAKKKGTNMTVGEVIKRLQMYGSDVPVFIYADHGQQDEEVYSVEIGECGRDDDVHVEGVCISS